MGTEPPRYNIFENSYRAVEHYQHYKNKETGVVEDLLLCVLRIDLKLAQKLRKTPFFWTFDFNITNQFFVGNRKIDVFCSASRIKGDCSLDWACMGLY